MTKLTPTIDEAMKTIDHKRNEHMLAYHTLVMDRLDKLEVKYDKRWRELDYRGPYVRLDERSLDMDSLKAIELLAYTESESIWADSITTSILHKQIEHLKKVCKRYYPHDYRLLCMTLAENDLLYYGARSLVDAAMTLDTDLPD
jgi:hypothetical protein